MRAGHGKSYHLYGLDIVSEIPLKAPPANRPAADLVIRLGEPRNVPAQPPPGELLAHLELGRGRGYSLARTPSGYLLRFHGACEFRISNKGRAIWAHRDATAAADLLELLLSGTVFSFLLGLAGEPVFHASAVASSEGVLAFVGGLGAGKSTLAALVCGATGARLVTDDLLRISFTAWGIRCFAGCQELRLRAGAAGLARSLGGQVRTTPDDRTGVWLPDPPANTELRAVVCPLLVPDADRVQLQALSPKDAFLRLVTASPLAAWKASFRPRAQFRHASEIVKRVPVYSARVPVEQALTPETAARLAGLISAKTPQEGH